MDTIEINGKRFRVSLTEAEIQKQVARVASEINRDYEGQLPVFLAVLNGSFIFAADLVRQVTVPHEIHFVKVSSYHGTQTTGTVTDIIGLNIDIQGRPIIIIEDIVDTGLTMQHVIAQLTDKGPKSIDICTLLLKPAHLQVPLDVRYSAFQIPNDFILGYGLDYDNVGRNLPAIYTIVE